MTKKRAWCLLFTALVVGACWMELRTTPGPLRAFSFPSFVFVMISLQLLLAVSLWGFSRDVWTPEMAFWDRELRKASEASEASEDGDQR